MQPLYTSYPPADVSLVLEITIPEPKRRRRFEYLALIGILMLAILLRLGWVVTSSGAIDTEGAEYARIAQNLLDGKGYAGISWTPGG